jgi:hypothetical protein
MPTMKSWTKRICGVVAALVWLGGCGGPHTAVDLRKNPHSVYSFEAPADCNTVYMRIVGRTRQRYVIFGAGAHQPGISAKLQPSGESATISLWDAGRIGFRYILSADLKQIEPDRTAVDIYCASRADHKEALLWEAWANTPLAE